MVKNCNNCEITKQWMHFASFYINDEAANLLFIIEYLIRVTMSDIVNEESASGTFEDCEMSLSSNEMCDLALKFLAQLRNNKTKENVQINALEALCQITNDILHHENIEEEGI